MAAPPVGVFDSGVGGLSVLRALRAALPHQHCVYFADAAHAPYGEQTEAAIVDRSLAVVRHLVEAHGIGALVVACNTATACAIGTLRAAWPDMPIVGVEPALKPAALLTRTGRIAVFATHATVRSQRFASLLAQVQAEHPHPHLHMNAVACDGLAQAIEAGNVADTEAACAHAVRTAGRFGPSPGEVDTLVLGCTHYPFAETVLRDAVGPAVRFIETGEPVARRTVQLLDERGLRATAGVGGLVLESSGDLHALQAFAARVL